MKEISYNFGAIRDSIMKLSASELIKESKSRTLDSFTNAVKKSPILSKQHLMYKSLQECKPFEIARLAERFLNQHIQLFVNEKWEKILAENKTLRRELLDDFHVEAKADDKLFEAINTLIESITKGGFKDFERELESYEFVLSHLTRKVIAETDKSKEKTDAPKLVGDAWKFITKMAINNFNERFKHLNENEKKAFKILISDNNTKSNYLESLRKENIEVIDQKIITEKDTKALEVFKTFKGKLENMKNVNFNSLDECIISCLELKETLK